jgi:hypothetical protein
VAPPIVKPVSEPPQPPKSDLLQPNCTPQGTWRDIGGVRCYEAGRPGDGPPLLLLPDAFLLEKHTPASLQVG